ncbi:MAG: 2-oxo-4-hydroxy-4-carboxy-5-ureidoimidazoline decarboxylase [Micrococcales bacterium]|nr:2-oxo-4-hydroxy-4-carboxy-5-ureidoimidazoline decarboxylase [Micrococcales bacterium]
MPTIADFNAARPEAAAAILRPCLDVERWISVIVEGRPYPAPAALVDAAQAAAHPLTRDEVDAALAHHPRIGDRAQGDSAEAGLSRGEQSTLDLDSDVQTRLAAGNAEYERRFDRVFLIRAAGRTAPEILDQLNARLENDDETEAGVVAQQLREIAVLRLQGAVSA